MLTSRFSAETMFRFRLWRLTQVKPLFYRLFGLKFQ
jgi:hypothetical protein